MGSWLVDSQGNKVPSLTICIPYGQIIFINNNGKVHTNLICLLCRPLECMLESPRLFWYLSDNNGCFKRKTTS